MVPLFVPFFSFFAGGGGLLEEGLIDLAAVEGVVPASGGGWNLGFSGGRGVEASSSVSELRSGSTDSLSEGKESGSPDLVFSLYSQSS